MQEKNELNQTFKDLKMGVMLTFTVAEGIANFVLEIIYLIPLNIYNFKL